MKQIILFLGIFGYLTTGVDARDLGQWEDADPEIRQWYQSLMQPDVPTRHAAARPTPIGPTKSTSATARPTCSSPTTGRMNRAAVLTSTSERRSRFQTTSSNGTNRIPTGHGIVFLSRNGYVFCYVQPGGV